MARLRARKEDLPAFFSVLFSSPVEGALAAGAAACSAIALFLPWVGVVVVAARLPVARPVFRAEVKAREPLRALPDIEVRHEAADRRPVRPRQRVAVVLVSDERVRSRGLGEADVGGVAVGRLEDHIARSVADLGELGEVSDLDAGPPAVEERPASDAVDVT